jgi:hypothetical protein
MTRLLLIACLLIGFSSCKSIRKAKVTQTVSLMQSANRAAVDSAVFALAEVAKEVEETEVTETIEQTFVPLDSSGFTIFKPVVIQKKTSRSTRTADSIKIEQDIKVSSTSDSASSSSVTDSKDLDKSSEGQDPIESITTALFPTWGKILAAILTAVVPVLWGWWKKRKEDE